MAEQPWHWKRAGNCRIRMGTPNRWLRLYDRFPGSAEIRFLCLSLGSACTDWVGARLPTGVGEPLLLHGGRDTKANSYHRSTDGAFETTRHRSEMGYDGAAPRSGNCPKVDDSETERRLGLRCYQPRGQLADKAVGAGAIRAARIEADG